MRKMHLLPESDVVLGGVRLWHCSVGDWRV